MKYIKARILVLMGYHPYASLSGVLFEEVMCILEAELLALVYTLVTCAIAMVFHFLFGVPIHYNLKWLIVLWQVIAIYKRWIRPIWGNE